MHGFGAFLCKELAEVFRTWRIWVLPGIVLFMAASGPPLARYTLEILRTVMPADQAGAIVDAMPEPTYIDSYLQWTKNLSQTVLIAAIIMFGGMVSSEKRSGTATLVLTKPLSRAAFVVAKFVSSSALLAVPVVLGAALTWGLTYAFFGEAPLAPLASATGAWLVLGIVFVALMELLSSAIDSQAGAAGIGLGAYILASVAAMWGPALRYSPAGLTTAPTALASGETVALAWPIATGVLLAAALMLATIAVFRRREL